MLIAAKTTELYYSSSIECPGSDDGRSFGAQFDLMSTDIKSCYINATTGYSEYCAGMEYRNANTGKFEFQTIVNQKGRFISSFTGVNFNIEITKCNVVNETITTVSNQSVTCGVIHIRYKNIVFFKFSLYKLFLTPY